ncbi:MAG: PDZ domain-containing protein [Gemmatimonadaceae bacterium]|nr:PDZ domain-containing protein [Gemmatimonadaceae bacterium]
MQRSLDSAERVLTQARAQLDARRRAMEDAASDSSGELVEAYARALGDVRRAHEHYSALVSELLRRELAQRTAEVDRARWQAERATRSFRAPPAPLTPPSGWLGVTFSGSFTVERSGGKEIMRFEDYPTIEAVEPDSPAERAGLEARDRLIALDGRDVTEGTEPLTKLLKPGVHLPVRVKRGPYTKDLTIVVGKRPQSGGFDWGYGLPAPAPTPPASTGSASPAVSATLVPPVPPAPPYTIVIDPDSSAVRIGIVTTDAGAIAGAQVRRVGELREYFGVSDGLLVLRVVPGTPAAASGLRGGDVIVRADGHAITTPSAFARALEQAGDRSVKLEVVRKKKTLPLVLRWQR